MAVPAHDERDLEFAETFDLPIVAGDRRRRPARQLARVRRPAVRGGEEGDRRVAARRRAGRARRVSYRLRDWGLSRQRYWGCPIPIVHCATCGAVPVPDDQLPVLLPEVEDYRPKGVPPLASNKEWLQHRVPPVRRPGRARGRHDGHVRRLVLVLPALRRPAQRGVAVRPPRRRLLGADLALHRRDRPRDRPPALLALLRQGDERAGPASASASRSRASTTRAGCRWAARRCRSRRATSPARTSSSRPTAPMRCASTSSSWAPPTRTWSGRTPGSRG